VKLIVLLLLFCAATLAHGQVMYRCERDGRIAFSDQPCPEGAKASLKTLKPSGGPVGTLDLDVAVKYYDVQGRDFEGLRQSLNAKGPKGFHGLSSWRVSYEYTTRPQASACRIATVKTKLVGDILMPRWADESSAPAALQRRWTTYYAALRTHEDGHIALGRELATLVKERLLGLGPAACDRMQATADAEYQRLYQSLRTRDQEYDARTGHGATQGAVFTPG
jgi:predicted secreted Zn-dependent protease